MSYKGRIQQLNVLKGRMLKKLHGLKISILPINNLPKAEFKPIIKYRATLDNGIVFGGLVKRLNVIFRFIAAKAELFLWHKAKPCSAPATLIEADSSFQIGKEAPATTAPATEITVDQKEKATVFAKLVAYRRARLVYTKRILIPYRTKLISVPGAVAKYREIMGLKLISKAEKAESAILESRNNNLPFGTYAHGISAPASVANVESRITADHEAPARKAVVVPVEADSAFKVSHRARLYSWVLPESNGNDLTIYQTFSGIQSGSVLEIDLEAESAYWANAFVSDGVMHLVFAETATQTDNELKVV